MPSSYTANYQLNQWKPEDRVLRADFNADNVKLEGALSVLSGQVAGKADKAGLEAETQARTAAVSAINTALALRGNCRVEAFTYTGGVNSADGSSNTIHFSRKPLFFIVAGTETIIVGGGPGGPVTCVYNVDGRSANTKLSVSWSGSTITMNGDYRAVGNRPAAYQVVAFYAEDAK